MVFSFFDPARRYDQRSIARAAKTTLRNGTSVESMVAAAMQYGFSAQAFEDMRYVDLIRATKQGTPVIVNWFMEDVSHYSVVGGSD